ncbi:tetratricopeptide repeat protein [Flavitalea flava]
MATYDKETIIRYVDNELSPEEKQQIEEDLVKDASLAGEIDLYRQLKAALQERLPHDPKGDALLGTLREMNKKYFAPSAPSVEASPKVVPFRKYFTGMAAAAAVIIAVVMLWPSNREGFLEKLGHTDMISTTERGGNTDSLLQQASEFFNKQQFDRALPLLDRAVKEDSSSQLALFYRGVTQWHTGAADAARRDLEKVYDGGSALQYEAAFYMAISYAGQKNKPAALEWLKRIPEDTPVSDKAKQLKKELE